LLAYERDATPDARSRCITEMFRAAHSLKGAAHAVGVAPLERLCHEVETRLAPAREGRGQLDAALIQLLLAATDTMAEAGRELRAGRALAADLIDAVIAPALPAREAARAPTAILAESDGSAVAGGPGPTVRIASETLDAILARSAEVAVERRRLNAGLAALEDLGDFVADWRAEWPGQRAVLRRSGPDGASVGKRLDDRLSAVATLVADRAKGAREPARALDRVSGALEGQLNSARMLPFAEACGGLERVVRDLALLAGKEARLEVAGGDVALDRVVVTRLRDVLRHLVRNAIDHGVELPRDRMVSGKPATATVRIDARVEGDRVLVTVTDDGAGFDDEAIQRRANERGLAMPRDRQQLARAVLTPGFSTRIAVTAVSGRGVGLDIVRTTVESLHGSLDLSWEPGRGSRCELRVPLSLATTHVVLVRSAGTTFALPASQVLNVRRAGAQQIRSLNGRPVLVFEGEAPVPLVTLAAALGLPAGDVGARGLLTLVVVGAASTEVAFAVDEAVGEVEVVATGLGRRLHDLPLVSGAAVLENGEVAVVLKPTALVRAALSAPATQDPGADRPAAASTPQRILVVDDSATTRSLVRSILEGAGYEVAVAVDGAAAWAHLQERLPDLMVTDVDMPRMDGFALCEAVRRSPRTRGLRVVLVTALGSDQDRARGMEVGADAYVVKAQFDQGTLLDTLRRLLA